MQAVAVLAGVALMAWMVPGGVPRWQRLRAVLLGLLLLALATWWFVDRLSGDGFNAATIYHLRSDMEGAGIADFRKPMLAYAGLLLASLILPLLLLRRRPAPTATRGSSPWIFAGGLALALLASPLARDGLRLYRDMRPADGLAVAGDYVLPQRAPGKPLNIVWLYAESLERTYLDPVTFPGLLPNVAALAGEGLDFRGLSSPQGSGWTIAGLVASQCGVPLTAAPGDENSLGRMAHFLPEARCLSDYLRDHGYHASFIGGADGTFAGKAGFLRDHGYAQVHDLADFRDMRLSRRDFSPWGVHDDVLLDHAWNEFQRLSQAGTPFLLSALTLDTHHPAGHLPVACRRRANDPGPQGRAGMLAALRCSDRLIGQFVQRIRNSPWADNTLLVVASDHLAMPNALSAELEALPRENLLLMFGAGLPPREVPVMAAGSTLDSGATVLALLGAGDQLGFGRSLLADVPGGPASRAAGEDSDGYRRYLAFANGLWTRGNPRRLQVEGDRLRVGAQEVRLPVLLDYDRNWQLAGMMLEDVPGRFRRSRPEHALAYVDRCTAFDDDAPEAGWCAMVVDAAQGARLYRSAELAEGVRVDAPRLAAADHRRDGLRQPVMLGRAIRDTGPGAYQVRVQAPRLPAHPFWIEAVTAQGQLLGQFRVEPGTGPDGRIHMPLWLAESVDDMQIRVWLSNLDELDDPGSVDVALVNDHDRASSS